MFSKALIVSAISALAAAQSSVLTFTHVPNPVTDGKAQAITYDTNDTSSPVSIILRKGPSGNLQTIQTLTSSATGGQFVWNPESSLPNGNDYALEIKQGDQINYFGPFVVEGASASSYGSSSSSASATGYTSSSSSSASATGYTSSSANVTSTTLTVPYGTAPGSSMGTGTAMSRNTTMSSATLSSKHSMSATPASVTAQSSGAAGTSASTGGATAASPSSTSSGASGVVGGSSSLALVFGAVAAIFYLQ